MPSPRSDPVAEFKRLLEALPESRRSGGVELLLGQMEPQKARLLRLCAIPHEFDPDILRALAPELDTELARQRCAEFARLAIVIGVAERLALHEEARDHLFHWWLQPQNSDTFAQVNATLVEWFSRQRLEAVGEHLEELQDQRMFHLLGCDQASGFAEFEHLFAEARHVFRLSRCTALIRLVEEYRPVLDPGQRLRLDYHAGKLAADRRDLDAAQALLEGVLANPQTPAGLRIKTLTRLGQLAAVRHAWPQAIAHYREALALAADPDLDFPSHGILHDLAAAHRDSNELAEAELILQQAIEEATRADSTSGLAACYNSLGNIQLKRGDLESAIEAYRKCLDYLEGAGQRFRMAQALNNLGMSYVRQNDLEQGERYLRQSLNIKREASDRLGQASTLANLVQVYRRQGRTGEALETSLESITLFDAMHDTYRAGIAYLNLGQLYRDSKRADLARQTYNEAITRFRACGAEDEIEATQKAIESLAGKRGLPWWAWTVMVFSALLVILAVIGLLVVETETEGVQHFATSGDNRRWVFSSESSNGWTLNVDGETLLGPYDELLPVTPFFSPDGRRLAYAARQDDNWFVVLDGEVFRYHDGIVPNSLAFSPDGQRFAYAARDREKYRLIADGEASSPFDEILPETVIFSPDSRHLSYRVRIGDHHTLVLDGEPGLLFDRISLAPWVFSPDSSRVTYSGVRDGKHMMVIDGEARPTYDNIYVDAPVFSPDSRRIAYGVLRDNKWRMVVDDVEGEPYDDLFIGPSLFSPDSQHITYVARKGERFIVVIDDQEQEAFQGILEGTPRFSPNGKRVVYGVLLRNGKWIMVEAGSESPAWDGILQNTPQFSPDSRRIAYGALRNNKWRMVVDDVEGKPYDDLSIGPSLFSTDSQHLVYSASDGTNWFVVVDGKPRRRFEWVRSVVFDGANLIRYLAYTEREGIRVVEESITTPPEQSLPPGTALR